MADAMASGGGGSDWRYAACAKCVGASFIRVIFSVVEEDPIAALGLFREVMNCSEKSIQISRSEPHDSSLPSGQYVTFTRAALVTIPESSLSVRRMGSAPTLSHSLSTSVLRGDDRTTLARSSSTRRKLQLPQRSLSLSKALPPPPSSSLSRESSRRSQGSSASGFSGRRRHSSLSKRSGRPLPHISSLLELKKEEEDQSESELTKNSRRKLSTASSNKSGNKEASRSRATSSAIAETASTPSNRTDGTSFTRPNAGTFLKSAVSFPSSSAVEDESASAPIFGSVAGGSFRSNIFGRTRERGSSKGEKVENSDDRKNNRTGDTLVSPTGDSGFNGGRGRGPGEFTNVGLGRKLSGRRRNKHSLSPNRENASGANSADEDNSSHAGRRGSVIGKVAQKAKLVLPLKRNSRDAKLEGPKGLAVKTSPSSSSFQESPKTQLLTSPEAGSSSEGDEDDENEAENGNRRSNTLTDRPRAGTSKPKTISFAASSQKPQPSSLSTGDSGSRPPSSSAKKDQSPATSPSSSGFAPPEGILRPRSVPPRKASIADATQIREAMPPANLAMTRRSNKILELAPADLKPPEMPSGSSVDAPKLSPVRTPTTTGTIGIESKRNLSTTAIEGMARPTSHSDNTAQSPQTNTAENKPVTPAQRPNTGDRPSALRQASSGKVNTLSKPTSSSKPKLAPPARQRKHPPSLEPPMPDPEKSPKVDPAPPSGMYWSKAPCYGHDHTSLRAHTVALVGSGIYVFGGCDSKACFNDLYVFDADSMFWSKPECTGDIPPPLRAMTTTTVGKKLIIFGGGDGPTYYNDIYILDTISFRYTKPKVGGVRPSKRRAHTACLYKNGIYVFGGGDGVRALNDVWRLDVSDMTKLSWKLISAPTSPSSKPTTTQPGTTMTNGKSGRDQGTARPTARGYHTANIVGAKLIIFGGSDGVECFRDVWVFDVETFVWKAVDIKVSYPRLSHTATVVGSYLFVIGGHDGIEYSSEVLLLNLVTMLWDRRKVYGLPPSGRGYHGTALHDSRLFVLGGFDGTTVFDDTYILELAVSAYYSQISHFTIDV
ncbi:hypothetical protein FGG08_003665 [Glutinoglossum americanum]|uniref:Tip elongation aberrant protein 1 n=1 Tax=Glutinoglossum americanum TaxID=1670608 RepID=A0A9P8I201_9PEZI|nr:hypothetical protein FGG08_003665 [Glutinoglossum americanum]